MSCPRSLARTPGTIPAESATVGVCRHQPLPAQSVRNWAWRPAVEHRYVGGRLMDASMSTGRRRVVALITDGTSPFELGVACEVFGLERPELGLPWYEFRVVSGEGRTIKTSAGFTISTPYGLDELSRADTVVIPAWHDIDRDPPRGLVRVLRNAHARGARMVSVCSGAFLLAAAGLLDGRRATTHWRFADQLARRYPKVEVDARVLYVDDGDVLTSAGTAAGIDLCLHIVRRDYGSDVANAVARRMVVPPQRPGGQAQYIELPVPRSQEDDLAGLRQW